MIQPAAQLFPPTRRSALPGEGMLVAIAPQVEDYRMLAEGVLPGARVLILDGDAIGQITAVLEGDRSLTSLHIICHGAPGVLELGTTRLSGENVGRYRHQLRRWRAAEILLYACNVAALAPQFWGEPVSSAPLAPQFWGEPVSAINSPRPELGEGPGVRADTEAPLAPQFWGEPVSSIDSPRPELGEGPGVRADLLSRLHKLTGANIAAASGWVGSAKKGGSWNLDRAIGRVRRDFPFVETIKQYYSGILATFTVTNTNDTGAGSLRQAIEATNITAEPDTIIFNIPITDPNYDPITGSYTIQPLSPLPAIINPVIIDGTSQPGFANSPIIEIDGSLADDGVNGFTINAGNSSIKSLVINRFSEAGIVLTDTATGNEISGNFIGTDVTGNSSFGNRFGINIAGDNNVIGGAIADSRNLISGNTEDGINLLFGASGNQILGNFIGTDITGAAALGNGDDGISILDDNNLIGGSDAGNTIAFNDDTGVAVQIEATGNAILDNSIFDNENLGIDLDGDGGEVDNDGVTPNDGEDEDTGGNNLQNYPILTAAIRGTADTSIEGTLNSTPNTDFTVQFFSNQELDPSGFGEGETFLGQTTVTTDAAGNVAFSETLSVVLTGTEFITATATEPNNNTSEFSAGIPLNIPPNLDLDGTAEGINFNTNFAEGEGAIAIADTPQIADPDSANLESATLTLSVFDSGSEALFILNPPAGIEVDGFEDTESGQYILELTGTAAIADYQSAIAGVIYDNIAADPDTEIRTVEVIINDGQADSEIATTTITITPNLPPVAADDTATTSTNIPITFNITDNDSDSDGNIDAATVDLDPATEGIQTSFTAAEGEFIVDEVGDVTFIPNTGFVGNSAIAYTVRDNLGKLSNEAIITVNVENTPPTATDDSILTLTGVSASVDVLANDSDPDGDNLTVIATTAGNFGTTAIADNNRVIYTPNPGFRGNDSFTYTISDPEGGTDTARVNLSILNSNPIAFNNSATTPSNIPINISVLGNDYDADGDILSLVDFTSGENGDVTRDDNGTPEILTDDTLIYTPNPGFNGSDTFTYTVDDGNGGTDTGTVIVEVTNATPTATDDTAETSNTAAVTIDVLANDSDPDDDILSITNVVQGENGSVEINDNNTVTYTPNPDFLGTDTFTYTVEDGNENTATATVTVAVTNSPPVAEDDTAETRHNPAFTITPQNLATVTIDVLANDSDPDDDILSITNVVQGENGSVEINDDNTVTYTPNLDFLGTDTFTYTVEDGNENTATATVTVEVTNSPPIANDDIIEVTSGTSTQMPFLLNDRDPDGDILVVTSATQPMNGELNLQLEDVTIFYTSNPGFVGTDSFTYTISDRLGGTDTATITVNVVNFAPIVDLDGISPGVNFNTIFNVGGEAIAIANNTQITDSDDTTLASATINFTPLDGEFETLSLTTIPPEITVTPTPNGLNLTGTASWEAYQTAIDGIVYNNTAEIPTPGDRTITVTANDGKTTGEVATTTVRLNNPPIIPPDLNAITTRADTPASLDILTEASDPEGDTIAISDFTNGENGTVTLSENGLIYTPNPGFGGIDNFTYTLADSNGATASATVTVGVSNIVVTPPTPPVTAENDGSAVDVALSLPPTADVRVGIISSDPTEAIVVPNTLIFTPENFSTPQTVIVGGISDFEIDGDSAFDLIIAPADSTDPNYTAIDPPDVAFTNIDTTSIIEFSTPAFAVSEENPAIAITRNNTAGVVGVRLVLSGGTATPDSDYDPIPLNVSFDEGENSKFVTLPIVDDSKIEAAETVDIRLENPQANAVLGSQTVANVAINPSDGGALNLNIQNLISITSTNPQLRDRGVEFSDNALGIEEFNLNGSGNFIDEKLGQSDAITYDRGDSIDIDVPEGFVDEISFRYASPFRSHEVVIRDAEGNELASRTLLPTEDSGLTPGAYVLSDRVTTIEFEGTATSVELGSKANKLLIADLMLGSSDNNSPELGFVGAIADPFTQLF